jgi:outer membrane protein TolC
LPIYSFDITQITTTDIGKLDQLIEQAITTHPKIKMLNNKSNILDIEKRLKTVELFPSLKLNYNALDNNLNSFNWNVNTTNNYKYGVTLSMPLFQRQARGDIAKTKNKIEDLNWDKKYINYEIENKVKSSFAEFHALKQQIKTNERVVNANKLLLDVENTKFQMGESSLFLINSRELKFIETELKQVTLKVKFYNSIYKNLWSIGSLN